jgi:hypothetical protein
MENAGWYDWLIAPLPFGGLAAPIVIAIALLWVAIEIRRSRKAAEAQTRINRERLEEIQHQTRLALAQVEAAQAQSQGALKPVLVLVVEQAPSSMGEGKLGLQRLLLRNIGLGPAFNVRIRSFEHQEYRVEVDPMDFIEKHGSRALSFVVRGAGQISGLARSPILLETALLAEKNTVVSEVLIDISYGDTFGNRYRTNAEMTVDHLSGRIGVHYPNICSAE